MKHREVLGQKDEDSEGGLDFAEDWVTVPRNCEMRLKEERVDSWPWMMVDRPSHGKVDVLLLLLLQVLPLPVQ